MKGRVMKDVLDFLLHLPGIPMEYLVVVLAFAALGLAAFTLHVVHSIVTREKSQ
jgi:hypothetical protein